MPIRILHFPLVVLFVAGCASAPRSYSPIELGEARKLSQGDALVNRKASCVAWRSEWDPFWARVAPEFTLPKNLGPVDRSELITRLEKYPKSIPEIEAVLSAYLARSDLLEKPGLPVFDWTRLYTAPVTCALMPYWNGMKNLLEVENLSASEKKRHRSLVLDAFDTLMDTRSGPADFVSFRIYVALLRRACEFGVIEVSPAALIELWKIADAERSISDRERADTRELFKNIEPQPDLEKARPEDLERFRLYGLATFRSLIQLREGPGRELRRWRERWLSK